MLKKVIPFLLIIVFISSCGTASTGSGYAAQIAPALDQLVKWKEHNQNLETLLAEPTTSQNGMSRLDMLELYNMATDYKITRDDYAKLGFLPLDSVVGDAKKVADEGKSIETILATATPDQGIKAAHETVLKCVQARTAFAESLYSGIKTLGPVDLSGNASACNTFDADLQKLTAYVNEHK